MSRVASSPAVLPTGLPAASPAPAIKASPLPQPAPAPAGNDGIAAPQWPEPGPVYDPPAPDPSSSAPDMPEGNGAEAQGGLAAPAITAIAVMAGIIGVPGAMIARNTLCKRTETVTTEMPLQETKVHQ